MRNSGYGKANRTNGAWNLGELASTKLDWSSRAPTAGIRDDC